jgi:hypothetical protein
MNTVTRVGVKRVENVWVIWEKRTGRFLGQNTNFETAIKRASKFAIMLAKRDLLEKASK